MIHIVQALSYVKKCTLAEAGYRPESLSATVRGRLQLNGTQNAHRGTQRLGGKP